MDHVVHAAARAEGDGVTESLLVRRILLHYGRTPTVRLFRNTTGFVRVPGAAGSQRGIHYGLCVGSSDLIGWRTAHGVAQFVALECKAPRGALTPEQRAFLAAVLAAGGIAGCVRSVEECEAVIGPPQGGSNV